MDHYQQGKDALEARQFFEAESYFRKALKVSTPDQKEEILSTLFAVVKVTHPENAWREARELQLCRAQKKNWKELLTELAAIESEIPELRRGFILELRAEALFHLGHYGEARKVASAHLEYLLRKRLIPPLVKFAPLYRERFPLTILFYFQEVTARVLCQDFAQTRESVKRLLDVIDTRWHQLEDVTGRSRAVLLNELVKTLEAIDGKHGEAALMTHYCRLTYLLETKQPLEKEDWKKLTELLIFDRSWRNWKLALEVCIEADDEALSEMVHQQIKAKRGFSFVKFTRHAPALKAWLLERGHDRTGNKVGEAEDARLTDEDLALTEKPFTSTRAEGLSQYFMGEEELVAEESALRQIRLNPPPLDMVPDLIVTYEMLSFGRIVDWLIHSFIHSEEYPRVQKKIRYLSVLRDMRKRDYHHALATLAEMLGDRDITIDELKELKYAEGAIYHALGEKQKAHAVFAEVERIDPGYRRLRERNW